LFFQQQRSLVDCFVQIVAQRLGKWRKFNTAGGGKQEVFAATENQLAFNVEAVYISIEQSLMELKRKIDQEQ